MNKHLNYTELFQTVKDRIKESQVKVMVAENCDSADKQGCWGYIGNA
jgi:hypothetical protein